VASVAPVEETAEHELSLATAATEETPVESPAPPVAANVSPEPFEVPTPQAAEPAVQQQTPLAGEIPDPNKTHPSLASLGQRSEEIADSVSRQEWADLAASLQSKSAETPREKPQAAPIAATTSPENIARPAEASPAPSARAMGQSTEDTARSIPTTDWAALTANLQMKRSGPVAPAEEPAGHQVSQAANAIDSAGVERTNAVAGAGDAEMIPASEASAATPDPVLVEAVVQRILDKMRPQVVDIITREFLRPIVQALVTREITKH
jgi:hypothetical protein